MTNTNTSNAKLSKVAKAAGMSLLLVLLLSAGAPEAEAFWKVKSDWSKVQAVTPGTRTTVLLYKDHAPRGGRKIKGHFHSATAESITLMLGHGQPRTVEKREVRRVLVPRPLKKRYQGWITLAITSAAFAYPAVAAYDVVLWGKFLFGGVCIGAPSTFAFLVAPRMGGHLQRAPLAPRPGQDCPSVAQAQEALT